MRENFDYNFLYFIFHDLCNLLHNDVIQVFTNTKKIFLAENEGRNSGSLAWRLARGEMQCGSSQSYTFKLTEKEVNKKEFLVKYSPARDEYIRVSSDGEVQKGWQTGVKEVKDVIRKHETDWKTVYLARCGV